MTIQIHVKDLTFFRKPAEKKFEKPKYIFNQLNLEIHTGDRVGLIGHNGVGKSTLLRLLSGILKPDSGTISVSSRLTVLLDSGFGLDPSLSGRENVRTMAILAGVDRSLRTELTNEIMQFSELGQSFDQQVKTYSTGMVVRLVLSAQLFIMQDTGLIIDEGFGTADSAFQKKTFERVDTLMRSVPFLVLASHSEEMLQKYCNRGIVLSNGIISFDGEISSAIEFYRKLQEV
jgi:ABC-type polysaccharide/polyol phosphate transport system ATPase subunit